MNTFKEKKSWLPFLPVSLLCHEMPAAVWPGGPLGADMRVLASSAVPAGGTQL